MLEHASTITTVLREQNLISKKRFFITLEELVDLQTKLIPYTIKSNSIVNFILKIVGYSESLVTCADLIKLGIESLASEDMNVYITPLSVHILYFDFLLRKHMHHK